MLHLILSSFDSISSINHNSYTIHNLYNLTGHLLTHSHIHIFTKLYDATCILHRGNGSGHKHNSISTAPYHRWIPWHIYESPSEVSIQFQNWPHHYEVYRRLCMIFWSPSVSKFVRSINNSYHISAGKLSRIIIRHVLHMNSQLFVSRLSSFFPLNINSRTPEALFLPVVTTPISCPS